MQRYFVDTWYCIALLHPRDPHHRAVQALAPRLTGAEFVTHDGVLGELLTYFAGYGQFWRQQIASFVREALASKQFIVAPVTRSMFEDALTMYENRLDKKYSLVDCLSMRLMLRRDITHVLTNDHHFRQEGFVVVNE